MLYTITLRKVLAQKAHEKAKRRDAGRIVAADIEAIEDHEPTPEFAAMLVDELIFRLNVLRDDSLRLVAKLIRRAGAITRSQSDSIATFGRSNGNAT